MIRFCGILFLSLLFANLSAQIAPDTNNYLTPGGYFATTARMYDFSGVRQTPLSQRLPADFVLIPSISFGYGNFNKIYLLAEIGIIGRGKSATINSTNVRSSFLIYRTSMDIYFSIPTKPKFFCNLGVSWSGLKIEAEHIEANYYFNEGTYYQFPQLNLGLMYNAHYWQTKNSNFAFRINGGYSIATSKASLNSNYTMTDHKGTSFSNFFLSLQFYTWNKRKI